MNDALSIAQALIRCPSVTPIDAGALGVLESLLKAHGFETHRVTFSEAGTADVDNLYARLGREAPHITLASFDSVTVTEWSLKYISLAVGANRRSHPLSASFALSSRNGRG